VDSEIRYQTTEFLPASVNNNRYIYTIVTAKCLRLLTYLLSGVENDKKRESQTADLTHPKILAWRPCDHTVLYRIQYYSILVEIGRHEHPATVYRNMRKAQGNKTRSLVEREIVSFPPVSRECDAHVCIFFI